MVERTEKGLISVPNKPINVPVTSQWLAGQGSGSWYNISKEENDIDYTISRYTPNGIVEFEAQYKINGNFVFCIDCPYAFTYLSHFKSCNILQHGEKINFVNITQINSLA